MRDPQCCLSYWYPRIIVSGLNTPRTIVVQTNIELIELLDGKSPEGIDDFVDQLVRAGNDVGWPCFLRTGQTSAKHGWENTCYVERPDDLLSHVCQIVEFSECADMIGLPTNVWAVREFLPLQVAFTAFHGRMPVAREFRLFIENGECKCIHPYWPPESIEDPSEPDWQERLVQISDIDQEAQVVAHEVARTLKGRLEGYWSVDACPTTDGRWYITDAAEGAKSFHWPSCPNASRGK